MSSIWTKARKNTPEIDCGLCGFPTCATFARSFVHENVDVTKCPLLLLERYSDKRVELEILAVDSRNITKPAPEQPVGGILLSKPCMDAPELLMAEMRIFNGVEPGSSQKYGVLDPVILCWLLDCVSSRYQDMRCSKELAYAWGDMEETKVHILRDGRIRMRRARGKDHALESFGIIERTVIGATICNCCGHDLFSVLVGLAPPPTNKIHTVLKAGSTLSLNSNQITWTLRKHSMDTELEKRIFGLIEPINESFMNQLNQMISGNFTSDRAFDARPNICSYISMMLESSAQEYLVMFLKGLAHAFFLDNALQALSEIRHIVNEEEVDSDFVIELLKNAKIQSLEAYNLSSMDDDLIPLLAHAARVARGLELYSKLM
ncbi:MAG: (Fe-S)-binding protein [Candidatus Thorarchaeota archaeon]